MPDGDAITHVPADAIAGFIAAALGAVGLPPDDAASAGAMMARTDLLGADGHGVFRLPKYVARIRAGGVNPRAQIRVERRMGAMAVLDGDNGMGQLVMQRAAHLAVEIAREQGVGWVGAHHSNHAGAAAPYAMIPLEAGMIGLYVAVGSANHLPPWGGSEMLLSTNPIAVAIPAEEERPVLLDMATTVAAYGKVKLAAQRGEAMPEGWMVDREGRPLTDPLRAAEGFLLPIGGPKGFGLALVFGLLAGTLNGAAFGRDVVDFNADSSSVTNTGQFVVALNLEAFGDSGAFRRRVDTVVRDMKSSPLLPGFNEIRMPGERSQALRDERLRTGIPLPPALRAELRAVATELGIAAPGWL